MKILFYDIVTPSTYTEKTLLQTGLGGTEATITRVAHALKNHHTVYVAQHCRARCDELISDGVHYLSLETANKLSPDVVVLLRDYHWIDKIGLLFPKAKRYFWMHNMPSKSLYKARVALSRYDYQIIAVSHFHAKAIARRLLGKWYQRVFQSPPAIPIHVLYNPISDELIPDQTAWNKNQLFLASTPYKGLAQNLKAFEAVLQHYPEYELLIATYSPWDNTVQLPKQVRFIGSLPHHELIKQIRKSFCVFYPQYMRCETFGLVYAESNAVGTPVLAHDFGAAREVLSDATQVVNGRSSASILEKITEWRKVRPILKAKSEFLLSEITKEWNKLLLP